jgi:D-serine deaminase-like pyridoxal phosphate-dependent protein
MRRPAPWRISAAALRARAFPGSRPADRGEGGHDAYFAALSVALKREGVAQPTLVIDAQRLAANILIVQGALAPTNLALRVVTKSLQAPALLRMVMEGAGTERLMVFNGVMLDEMTAFSPMSDVLLGRPLPVAQAARFVDRHTGADFAAARPAWLIDSPRRLTQYIDLARARGAPMRISFDIDVGLRRGGFAEAASLAGAIDLALAEPLIEICGLMGYDAHAAGAASPKGEVKQVIARYGRFATVLGAKTGKSPSDFTLNTAGSLTWSLHLGDKVANEVSIGSAFVKPTHFDTPLLADFEPAVFIAEPVLKAVDPPLIPGLDRLAPAIEAADPNHARGFYLYGGYGDARPVSPRGLAWSRVYGGRSLLTGSRRVALEEDDFVFLRPTETEAVLLQFGPIAVFDGDAIAGWSPTFQTAA